MADTAKSADWAVVTIAREPPEVIRRFVSWHLAMGAARIRIYFDDPADPMIAGVAHLPQVEAVPCTPEFWRSVHIAPDRFFTKRQNRAMQHAYNQAGEPWLFVTDADELLWWDRGPLGAFLSDQAAETQSLLFRPAERITVHGAEGFFVRRPMPLPILQELYGPLAGALKQRGGLVGHSVGKSIYRTGIAPIRLRQHFAEDGQGGRIPARVIEWQDGGALLHLMNNSYPDWRRKLGPRIGSWSMTRGLKEMLQQAVVAGDEAVLKDYFARLYTVPAEKRKALEAAGVLTPMPIDPDHAVGRYF